MLSSVGFRKAKLGGVYSLLHTGENLGHRIILLTWEINSITEQGLLIRLLLDLDEIAVRTFLQPVL